MKICKDSRLCCGCSACAAVCAHAAIKLLENERGFYRPVVDKLKCVECGLCAAVCPANEGDAANLKQKPLNILAYANTDDERRRSSSGAAFWALAQYAFQKGGVVYGACFDKDFRVAHKRCEDEAAAQACRVSKYSQSFVGAAFAEVLGDLRQGKLVLFSGAPCQVAGLRSVLAKKGFDGTLVTCDFVCHGTPSNRLFREYIAFLEDKSGKKVVRYIHRPKDRGWGKFNANTEKAIMSDGSALYGTVESDVWRSIFYSNDALNSCCYRCLYTDVGRVADFTLADFIGVDRFRKDLNDDKGLSVVMVNSEIAGRLVAEGVFEPGSAEIALAEVIPGNPMLQRPSIPNDDPDKFWRVHERKGFEGVARFVGAYGFVKRVKTIAKCLIGRVD